MPDKADDLGPEKMLKPSLDSRVSRSTNRLASSCIEMAARTRS